MSELPARQRHAAERASRITAWVAANQSVLCAEHGKLSVEWAFDAMTLAVEVRTQTKCGVPAENT